MWCQSGAAASSPRSLSLGVLCFPSVHVAVCGLSALPLLVRASVYFCMVWFVEPWIGSHFETTYFS